MTIHLKVRDNDRESWKTDIELYQYNNVTIWHNENRSLFKRQYTTAADHKHRNPLWGTNYGFCFFQQIRL